VADLPASEKPFSGDRERGVDQRLVLPLAGQITRS
jgi:hypothetical protein